MMTSAWCNGWKTGQIGRVMARLRGEMSLFQLSVCVCLCVCVCVYVCVCVCVCVCVFVCV